MSSISPNDPIKASSPLTFKEQETEKFALFLQVLPPVTDGPFDEETLEDPRMINTRTFIRACHQLSQTTAAAR